MNQSFKKNMLALGVAAAFGMSTSAYAQLAAENPGVNGVNPGSTLFGGDIILIDQTDSPDGNGVPDQDFEAAYDAYDAIGADDFVVTDPTGWTVNAMNTIGTTGTAGNATVTIEFYPDAGGTPDVANPVCTFPGIVPVDTLGSFNIAFPASCILPSDGTTVYWVSQLTDQNFGADGQHFWSGRSIVDGNESQWANAGGGFGTPCATFMPAGTVCGVGGGLAQDRLFSLEGVLGGGGPDLPPPPAVPTFNRWGTAILALGLLAVGMLVRRRRTQ